jgi:hypothetical protein
MVLVVGEHCRVLLSSTSVGCGVSSWGGWRECPVPDGDHSPTAGTSVPRRETTMFPVRVSPTFWSPPSSVGSQGRHGVPCKRTVSGVAGLLCMLLQSLFRASGGRPVLTRQCLCPWVAEWVEWIVEVIIWRGCWFSRCFLEVFYIIQW